MVKDHSDSKRGNPLPPHGLFFPINSKGFFYMHHPTDRIAHTTAFVTPVVEHWLERSTTGASKAVIYDIFSVAAGFPFIISVVLNRAVLTHSCAPRLLRNPGREGGGGGGGSVNSI